MRVSGDKNLRVKFEQFCVKVRLLKNGRKTPERNDITRSCSGTLADILVSNSVALISWSELLITYYGV